MTTVATDPPPDWAAAPAEVACPLCSYNLRGLTVPRCPECGFAFAWAELMAAGRDRHPWLFEHARRPRRAWALVVTWAAAAWPWSLWRTVTPANPVNVRRLVTYWAASNAVGVVLVVSALASVAVPAGRRSLAYHAALVSVPGRPGVFARNTDTAYADPISAEVLGRYSPLPWTATFAAQGWAGFARSPQAVVGVAAGAAVAWPWLTFAALLVFQASLRRAKVDVRHVLRAAVYGCDVGLLALVATLAVCGPRAFAGPYLDVYRYAYSLSYYGRSFTTAPWWATGGLFGPGGPAEPFTRSVLDRWHVPVAILVLVVVAAAVTVRLTVAYARYLRFHRPLLTVLAAQAIVLLVMTVVLLQVFGGL